MSLHGYNGSILSFDFANEIAKLTIHLLLLSTLIFHKSELWRTTSIPLRNPLIIKHVAAKHAWVNKSVFTSPLDVTNFHNTRAILTGFYVKERIFSICFRNCRLSSTPSRRGWINRTTTMPTTPTTRATTFIICRCTNPSVLLLPKYMVRENAMITWEARNLIWRKWETRCHLNSRRWSNEYLRCGYLKMQSVITVTRITRNVRIMAYTRNIIHISRRKEVWFSVYSEWIKTSLFLIVSWKYINKI